MLKPEWRGSIT